MTGKRRLGALFFDEFELLDIFGALEMFGVLPEPYEIVTVGQQPSLASTQGSVGGDRAHGQLDVLLVPGGVAAGIDMALAIIARLESPEVAKGVADHTEYDWHRDAAWDPFAKLNNLV